MSSSLWACVHTGNKNSPSLTDSIRNIDQDEKEKIDYSGQF